jgi:hypothetical protein
MSNLDDYTWDDDMEPSLKEILERDRMESFGVVRQIANFMERRRDVCHERGYHRVSEDKAPDTDEMFKDNRFCYDCETIFDKDYIDYRVEPH